MIDPGLMIDLSIFILLNEISIIIFKMGKIGWVELSNLSQVAKQAFKSKSVIPVLWCIGKSKNLWAVEILNLKLGCWACL